MNLKQLVVAHTAILLWPNRCEIESENYAVDI